MFSSCKLQQYLLYQVMQIKLLFTFTSPLLPSSLLSSPLLYFPLFSYTVSKYKIFCKSTQVKNSTLKDWIFAKTILAQRQEKPKECLNLLLNCLLLDLDECAMNVDGCQQNCINYPGGFNCTCFSGYRQRRTNVDSCEGDKIVILHYHSSKSSIR